MIGFLLTCPTSLNSNFINEVTLFNLILNFIIYKKLVTYTVFYNQHVNYTALFRERRLLHYLTSICHEYIEEFSTLSYGWK